MRKVVLLLAALLVLTPVAGADIADEIRTLDGSGNNRDHPDWGKTNTQYLRFFYQNDQVLPELRRLFGIDYRRTLAQIIEQNTGIDVQDNVFEAVG